MRSRRIEGVAEDVVVTEFVSYHAERVVTKAGWVTSMIGVGDTPEEAVDCLLSKRATIASTSWYGEKPKVGSDGVG